MINIAKITLLVSCFAGPVLAQDVPMLETVARDLGQVTQDEGVRAAVAACILGNGDPDATAARFADAGWIREDEVDMGIVSLTPREGYMYVTLYDGGRICDVASENRGTEEAFGAMQIVAGMSGLSMTSAVGAMGCDTYALTDALNVEITSTGNDPVCFSETTSNLRFTFAGTN